MKLAILGAGAWGTALAIAFSKHKNLEITLVTVENGHVEELKNDNENKKFLPGYELPTSMKFSYDIPRDADVLFSVGPAQKTDEIAHRIAEDLNTDAPVVFCSKGIIYKDHKPYLITDIAMQYLKNPLAILSGPTFAHEVAKGVPTAAVLASSDKRLSYDLSTHLQVEGFKLQWSEDSAGVQVAGSMKNIFAIASGVLHGMHLGSNTKSAFYVQCLDEMGLVGSNLFDAKKETFMGLAGIGDLILTCSDPQSRNFSLGLALASGQGYETYKMEKQALNEPFLTEGVFTADVIQKVKKDLALPICDFVHHLIHGGSKQAIAELVNQLLHNRDYLS